MTWRIRWFATSVVDPELLSDPSRAGDRDAAVIHAKEIGTVVTACGRHATTWHKHWTPFRSSPVTMRCKICAAVASEEPSALVASNPFRRRQTGERDNGPA